LSRYADGAFDCTVAYGGPISYAFDQAEIAVAKCLRVTRPGGVLLASVMASICWPPQPPTLCRWATQPRSTGWGAPSVTDLYGHVRTESAPHDRSS
jgi:hypothetical protein